MQNSLRNRSSKKRRQILAKAKVRASAAKTATWVAAPADPLEYVRKRGKVVTDQQAKILTALNEPPYAILAPAAHAVGKTYLAAMAVSHFYDRYNPGICLTTAPTLPQVRDLLFKELRLLRPGDPGWLPEDTRLRGGPNHWIHGLTANNPDAFQGRHCPAMMVVFDEAAGVKLPYWERALTMLHMGEPGNFFLGIFNPYDVSSPAYKYCNDRRFRVLDMSALDHPNVVTGQQVIPGAITRKSVLERIAAECRPLGDGEAISPACFTFEGKTYVAENPLFEVQILGRWPTRSLSSVWSDIALGKIREKIALNPDWVVQIGCDPARFGDDRTCICVRKGRCIVHLEAHRGWPLKQTAKRLKELARKYATSGQNPYKIPILIDAAGLGAGLAEMNQDGMKRYQFIEINSATASRWEDEWPNTRSELWFCASAMGEEGDISIAHLPNDLQEQLCAELRQPMFTLDLLQRRVVEAKAITKKRLGASPDLADAFNLACMIRASGWHERVSGRM